MFVARANCRAHMRDHKVAHAPRRNLNAITCAGPMRCTFSTPMNRRCAMTLFAAAIACACGAEKRVRTNLDPNYDALKIAMADLFDARCRSAMLCGDQGAGVALSSSCHPERVEEGFERARTWVAKGEATFDRDRAEACHAHYVPAVTCEEARALDLGDCLGMVTGNVKLGGGCTDRDQCMTGSVCSSAAGCFGHCIAPPAIGERCDGFCGDGATCVS